MTLAVTLDNWRRARRGTRPHLHSASISPIGSPIIIRSPEMITRRYLCWPHVSTAPVRSLAMPEPRCTAAQPCQPCLSRVACRYKAVIGHMILVMTKPDWTAPLRFLGLQAVIISPTTSPRYVVRAEKQMPSDQRVAGPGSSGRQVVGYIGHEKVLKRLPIFPRSPTQSHLPKSFKRNIDSVILRQTHKLNNILE